MNLLVVLWMFYAAAAVCAPWICAVRRRLAGIAACLLVLGLIADTILWRIATRHMMELYEHGRTTLAAQGWQVTSPPPRAAGWPFAAAIVLDDVRFGRSKPGGLVWTAPRVICRIALFRPRVVEIEPKGAQTLQGQGISPVDFRAERLVGLVPLTAHADRASVEAATMSVTLHGETVVVERLTARAAWHGGDATLHLTGGPARLPQSWQFGLGATLAGLTVDAVSHGAWPAGAFRAAAADWRDHGGTVAFDQASLRWGTLAADGTGTARLDGDLQPLLHLHVRVADPDAALASLADGGVISRGAALAAGAVLTLLAPAGNGGGGVDLPVEVKHGKVLLGRIPLMTMPKVEWH